MARSKDTLKDLDDNIRRTLRKSIVQIVDANFGTCSLVEIKSILGFNGQVSAVISDLVSDNTIFKQKIGHKIILYNENGWKKRLKSCVTKCLSCGNDFHSVDKRLNRICDNCKKLSKFESFDDREYTISGERLK